MWEVIGLAAGSLLALLLVVAGLALLWLLWRTHRLHRRAHGPIATAITREDHTDD